MYTIATTPNHAALYFRFDPNNARGTWTRQHDRASHFYRQSGVEAIRRQLLPSYPDLVIRQCPCNPDELR